MRYMSQEMDTDAAPLNDLTAFQRDMLKVVRDLERDDPIGKDVLDALGKVRNERIEAGRFYPNVMNLEDRGLIERHEIGGGQKKVVSLTDDGREAVRARARWWQQEGP